MFRAINVLRTNIFMAMYHVWVSIKNKTKKDYFMKLLFMNAGSAFVQNNNPINKTIFKNKLMLIKTIFRPSIILARSAFN